MGHFTRAPGQIPLFGRKVWMQLWLDLRHVCPLGLWKFCPMSTLRFWVGMRPRNLMGHFTRAPGQIPLFGRTVWMQLWLDLRHVCPLGLWKFCPMNTLRVWVGMRPRNLIAALRKFVRLEFWSEGAATIRQRGPSTMLFVGWCTHRRHNPLRI